MEEWRHFGKYRRRFSILPVPLWETYTPKHCKSKFVRRCGWKWGYVVELETLFDGWRAFKRYQHLKGPPSNKMLEV